MKKPKETPDDAVARMSAILKDISATLYGEKLELRIVDPKTIVTLKKNARYMGKATFDQLVSNVQTDGRLESVPLCHTLANGALEVLSGNHRVKAAIKAGLDRILVMVIPHELPIGKKRARQLSHNAIVGQDDMQLLRELWDEIDDLAEKLYSGLDSEALGELGDVEFSGFGPAQIRTEQITLWFLPEEVERVDQILTAMENLASHQKVYLAPIATYERLFKLITEKKAKDNIKNTAVAFMALVEQLEQANERAKAEVEAQA